MVDYTHTERSYMLHIKKYIYVGIYVTDHIYANIYDENVWELYVDIYAAYKAIYEKYTELKHFIYVKIYVSYK